MSDSPVQIRRLAPEDWDAVRAIYLAGIAGGDATFETTAPGWDEWNRSHLPAPRLAAVDGEKIVGWAALSAVSARAVYAGVAEVSVYVAPARHGHGIGRALLEALVRESEQNGIWTLQATIFPENSASLSLHRSGGFREVGTRRRIGKMKGVWRDTVLLERRSTVVGND